VHDGLTVFVLNNLSSQKVPAHRLGQVFRQIASSATEDPGVEQLFDLVTPREPLLGADDLPAKSLYPTDKPLPGPKPAMHLGRIATFNGMPLLDTDDAPIPVVDRDQDFRELFDWVVRSAPAPETGLRNEPPVVRGIPLWPLYFEFRARVLKARDNLDYFLVLREFLARFGDCGLAIRPTRTTPVPPGSPLWASVVGLDFARIGDRVYVARVTPDTDAAKAGVRTGLEVVTVDGRRASLTHDLLTEMTLTFESCPSRQRADARALKLLLTGAEGTKCALVLRDPKTPVDPKHPDEGTIALQITRERPPPAKADPLTVEKRQEHDGVVVIKVNQFANDAFQKFAVALEEVAKQAPKGLVIDVRGNEGYYDLRSPSRVSLGMLSRLLPPSSPKIVFGSIVQRDRAEFRKSITSVQLEVAPTATGAHFNGPVAVLTDAWTGGEAEWLVLGAQMAKLGEVVGHTSAGSLTIPKEPPEPWQSLLKSHVDVSVTFGMVVRPDGTMLQGTGVVPQVTVDPTPADLAAGRDTVLEAAIARLLAKAAK
jgi:C-terminal processing protease CtpA/Prc